MTVMAEMIHVVVKGDKLPEIAEKNGIALEDLMKLNGIENPHIIWIGQEIRIPGPEVAEEEAAPKKPRKKKAE